MDSYQGGCVRIITGPFVFPLTLLHNLRTYPRSLELLYATGAVTPWGWAVDGPWTTSQIQVAFSSTYSGTQTLTLLIRP